MAYSFVEMKNFVGLFLQQNSFTVPDGALEEAQNCTITMDGVISKRRGYYTFMSPSAGTLNNLFFYQNTLLAVYNNKIEWINGSGTATALGGETVSVTAPRVSRSAQSNDNLYFTTDGGPYKIEAYNGNVYKAGVAPGLDLTGLFDDANGPIGPDTQVGYRIVFGRRDANKNLLLGAPSDILVLTNRPIEDATYTSSGAGPYTITVTTSEPHNLSAGMTIAVSGATSGNADGSQLILSTPTAFTFTYDVASNPGAGILDYAVTRSTNLQFSVPEDVNSTEFFYQIYRTSQSVDANTAPSADFRLVIEKQLTSLEVSSNVVFVTDDVLVIFEGAELYTNPNSREGELQANDRPPLCEDIALFKDQMLYANCTTRQNLEVDLVSTDASYITNNNWLEIKQGLTTRRYVAREGVGNSTAAAESVTGTTTITVTYTAHGLVNGDTILVSNIVGTVTQGEYAISGVTANTFDFTAGVGQSASALDFQGVKNAANEYIFTLLPPGASPATGIDTTSRALVKAIDRDPSSPIYARYLSGITDIPGKMLFTSETFAADPVQVRAQNTTVGEAFNPELPAAFGSTVQSTQEVLKNVVFVSKLSEPEAVPAVNQLVVGSRNQAIQRIFALQDSVIVVKEDGIFRIDGDVITNFDATIVDNTVICVAPSSAGKLNNQVILLSNQGVCLVTPTSVQIISRKIETPIAAVVGSPNLLANTSAVTYESERLYMLTTLAPNTTTASVVYVYNTLTDSWTTWDQYFKQGVVGPQDKMFLISKNTNPLLDNKLMKERKEQNKLDYSGENSNATCISVDSDLMGGVFNTGSVTPLSGDVLVYSGIINRIYTAEEISPSVYQIRFESVTNIEAAATVVLYKQFISTIKMAPFHAGAINRSKQFAQFQIHTKDPSVSAIDISFANATFGSSEFTTWRQSSVALQGGWGQLPWGFFPWGLEQGINLTYSTQPAPPIRTYVPLFAQRSTFIQAVLQHYQAAEPMHIQSVGYQVRGYGERVSR